MFRAILKSLTRKSTITPEAHIAPVYVTHVEPNGITHIRFFNTYDAFVEHVTLLKASALEYRVKEAA